MDVSRSVTNRLINWIQEASLDKTLTSVAEEIGIDEKTVRNIFNDYVAELEARTNFRTPKWLGIDEVHLLKNYRCVITDVKNRSVIDILRKRNKDMVINAYTESLNRLIKTMNHVGRGYSFEVLRAKILFTQGYRKVKKKFKEVEVTFGKMLPDLNWAQTGYE